MPSAIAPLETSTTSRPSQAQRRDLLRPARERRAVEALPVVGDEAAADLDDQALRACERPRRMSLERPGRLALRLRRGGP